MRHRLANLIKFNFCKNTSDIIKNYQHLTGCDRFKQITQ